MSCQAPYHMILSFAAAGMIVACGTAPQLDHREVSSRVRGQLASNSRIPTVREQQDSGIKVEATMDADSPVTLPMTLRNGVPTVPVQINGRRASLLVDTGSQGCVLEARTAVACRVTILDHAEAYTTLGGTTGNERALVGLPDKVTIGSWVLGHFPFFVRTHETRMKLGPWEQLNIGHDLLGMNAILRACNYLTFDYPAQQVVFGIGRRFVPSTGTGTGVWKTPLIIRNELPYVQLRTNDGTWTALVDTGFNGILEIDRTSAKRLRLLDKIRPSDAFRAGLGAPVKGEPAHYGILSLPELNSLGPRMVNIPALVVPAGPKLGSALLHPFRVTLDFQRKLLWLENPNEE